MPRPVFDAVHSAPASTITGSTELTGVVSNGVSTSGAGSRVFIRGYLNVTAGTVGTTLTIRIRRGNGTGGALVGQADVETIVASTINQLSIFAVDSPGEVAGQQYSLTIQQGAGAGNGTINDGGIETTTE